MFGSYYAGLYLGYFAAGALVGVIPLIIALVKYYKTLGVLIPIFCGALAFVHPIASVICAAIFLIVTIFLPSQRPRDFSSWEKEAKEIKNENFERPAPPPEPIESMPTWKRIQLENQEKTET